MEIKNLNEVCMINMGQSPDSSSYNDKKEGLAFYQGNADFGEIHPTTRVWCNNPIKIAEKDDILISVRAPIGSMNIANEKCCIGRGLASIKPIDKNECNQNYLYYFLESKVPYMQSKGTGSTFKAINKGILTSLQIKLPNIGEQEKISSIISKIKAQIHNKKLQIRKYDELVKSQFIEMFENGKYPIKKIREITETTSGGTPASSNDNYYKGGTIPWINSGELNKGIITEAENFITEEGLKNSSAKYVPENSVLVAMYGATVGQVSLLKLRATTNQAVCAVLPNEVTTPEYLWYSLRIKKDYFIKKSSGGAQHNINQGIVKETEIPIPPLDLQNQFADFVKHIDKLKFRETITKLKNLCYNIFNIIQSKNLSEVKK